MRHREESTRQKAEVAVAEDYMKQAAAAVVEQEQEKAQAEVVAAAGSRWGSDRAVVAGNRQPCFHPWKRIQARDLGFGVLNRKHAYDWAEGLVSPFLYKQVLFFFHQSLLRFVIIAVKFCIIISIQI